MQRVYFNFDYKKATQALNFFALKEGGTVNKMKYLVNAKFENIWKFCYYKCSIVPLNQSCEAGKGDK